MRSTREKKKLSTRRTRTPDLATEVVDSLPVRKVSEVNVHRSYVFYGRSGTGKTTVAASFPKPLLLLDASDRGTDSVADVEDVFVMQTETWEDFETTYWYLVQHPGEYASVVIDTVSKVQGLAIAHILARKNKDTSRAGEWGVMTKQEWGDVASLMKMWITRYRDLPMEVVFVAQDRTFNFDEESDPEQMLDPEVGPQLTPSIAKHLNADVHLIANTFIREKVFIKEIKGKKKEVRRIQFCARIGPNPIYITKVRKPKTVKLPSVIVDPTYEDLQNLIKGDS